MVNPEKLFGRLGNKLFQYAFLVSWAKDHDVNWYFQDELWFKKHEDIIRPLFSTNIPEPTPYVAIHVRRGDYIDNPFYIDLTKTDYYKRAIGMFPGEKFMFFSDDIAWCKAHFALDDRYTFFHEDEITDMNKMASCKAHIIANSSFSYWGAWLSPQYPNNRVIAPKAWFADGDNSRTILPSHWERI